MLTDVYRCLGNRQSFASRKRERLASSFETKKDAKERHDRVAKERHDRVAQESGSGPKKRKKHSGNFSNIISGLNKEVLKQEVEAYEEGTIINWSQLARKFNVTDKNGNLAKNGGQVIQDVLINLGINVHQYKRPSSDIPRIRRRKLKGNGGEISVPSPECNESLKSTLKLKIANGDISVGEMIVPKRYRKLVLNKNNEVEAVEFVVEGRKIPLDEIRKVTLERSKDFVRQHPDEFYDEMSRLDVVSRLTQLNEFDDTEGLTKMRNKLKALERTRHMIIWHDHSTVANHGHLLFMVSILYDPAFHLTSEEYKFKTGKLVDIQEEVESPQVYIIARYTNE